MISAEQFLAILEERDLVPSGLLKGLRTQIAKAERPISAESVAKRLIEKGHLTPSLAKRLLGSPGKPSSAPTQERSEAVQEDLGATSPEKPEQDDDDELGLAPMPGEQPAKPVEKPRRPVSVAGPAKQAPPAAGAPRGSLLDEELASLDGPGRAAGPLDGLLADPLLAEATAEAGDPLAAFTPRRRGLWGILTRKKTPGKKANVWDSPLLLVGGGVLLLLVVAGPVLYWALTRESGDDWLEQADGEYRAGSYTQAIHKFDEFLERFPGHPGVGKARVYHGLARIHQVADSSGDWPGALQVTKEVLPEIEGYEEEFRAHARQELVDLLPKIAEALAAEAREKADSRLVARAREALAMVNTYVLKSKRPATRLADIEASLGLTTRQIARDGELNSAVGNMRRAITRDDPAEAYKIRRGLLKQYPSLLDNEKLKEAVLEVSRAQQSAVRWVAKQQAAETEEKPTPLLASLALARRSTSVEAPGVKDRVIFALAEGVAYGLEAASGKVLWRRMVGYQTNGSSLAFPPTPIANAAGSDAILVDALGSQLLRVEAASGRLKWRHPLGQRFDAHPVVLDDRLLVATRSGRLVTIDLGSGESSGYVQFPQELRVAPAVDSQRKRIYQLADHSNLFVLSSDDNRCRQVVYLGHEPGSVTVAPIVVNRFLVIAENDGAQNGTLHVLSLESAAEGAAVKPLERLRFKGHLDTPPASSGRRLLAATDVGALYVYEVSGEDAKKPLKQIAQGTAGDTTNLIRFPLFETGQCWVGDSQLTRFDLQASQGRLVPKPVAAGIDRSAFLQPLTSIGRTLFVVRRMTAMPGVLVSAVEMDEGKLLWENHLGAPLATEPILDAGSGQVTAVSSAGAVFQVETAKIKGNTVVDQPVVALRPAEVPSPIEGAVRLEGGLLAMVAAADSKEMAVFDPQESKKRFRWLLLPDLPACPPIAFAGRLLVPCKVGQVFLVDPRGGKGVPEPFQPTLASGVTLKWRRGALIGKDEVALADGYSRLFRLAIKAEPKPHLAAAAQVELSQPIVSPLAAIGQVVYAVDEADALVAYVLPELKRGKQWPLGGRCVWGPRCVGDHVFLSTDGDELLCLDGNQKLLWRVGLAYGPLAGAPLRVGESYIFAAVEGVLWRVDASTGKELGKIETGVPLGTGPVLMGKQLLLSGHDGSLYQVEQP